METKLYEVETYRECGTSTLIIQANTREEARDFANEYLEGIDFTSAFSIGFVQKVTIDDVWEVPTTKNGVVSIVQYIE